VGSRVFAEKTLKRQEQIGNLRIEFDRPERDLNLAWFSANFYSNVLVFLFLFILKNWYEPNRQKIELAVLPTDSSESNKNFATGFKLP